MLLNWVHLYCIRATAFRRAWFVLLFPPFCLRAGRNLDLWRPPSQTSNHLQDKDGDSYDESPVDAIVAAAYAVYQAEQMQLASYAPPESNLPVAVEARLARHIAELADEQAAMESVLESILARDEQEVEQVSLG